MYRFLLNPTVEVLQSELSKYNPSPNVSVHEFDSEDHAHVSDARTCRVHPARLAEQAQCALEIHRQIPQALPLCTTMAVPQKMGFLPRFRRGAPAQQLLRISIGSPGLPRSRTPGSHLQSLSVVDNHLTKLVRALFPLRDRVLEKLESFQMIVALSLWLGRVNHCCGRDLHAVHRLQAFLLGTRDSSRRTRLQKDSHRSYRETLRSLNSRSKRRRHTEKPGSVHARLHAR